MAFWARLMEFFMCNFSVSFEGRSRGIVVHGKRLQPPCQGRMCAACAHKTREISRFLGFYAGEEADGGDLSGLNHHPPRRPPPGTAGSAFELFALDAELLD